MTPRAILAALETGKMRVQGALLSPYQRRKLSEWITGRSLKETSLPPEAFTKFLVEGTHDADYCGWGGNLSGTGFRSTAQGGLTRKSLASLRLKWAFAFPDATIVRSKPAVWGNWLLVGDQYGQLYAINRFSGKVGWTFKAKAAIRGAIVVVPSGTRTIAYFADYSTMVYAIDARTGKEIWEKRSGFEQQSATTGSVAVWGGKVFVPISSVEVSSAAFGTYTCCSTSGGLVALDAHSGAEIWHYRAIRNKAIAQPRSANGRLFLGPSGAPVWCSPTLDPKRHLVYIGTGENYSFPTTESSDAVQAIDMNSGKRVWNFQGTSGDRYNLACPAFANCPGQPGPDLDFGMAPILVTPKAGSEMLVVGQKSGVAYALDPSSGKLIWRTRVGKGGALGGIHWGMCTDGKYVYAANSDNTIGLDNGDSTQQPHPGIFALDLLTGKLVWSTPNPPCTANANCFPFNSSAPAAIPGLVFSGSLDGHIRAYASATGEILWDFDTEKPYETSDNLPGKGGSLDGPAPVIAGGMLYVNSGYGMFGQMPGNVLLAFETAN
jgi:polyvinyl alcohol dehydrogenase (cytochrome)